jgi:hypothetical protein
LLRGIIWSSVGLSGCGAVSIPPELSDLRETESGNPVCRELPYPAKLVFTRPCSSSPSDTPGTAACSSLRRTVALGTPLLYGYGGALWPAPSGLIQEGAPCPSIQHRLPNRWDTETGSVPDTSGAFPHSHAAPMSLYVSLYRAGVLRSVHPRSTRDSPAPGKAASPGSYGGRLLPNESLPQTSEANRGALVQLRRIDKRPGFTIPAERFEEAILRPNQTGSCQHCTVAQHWPMGHSVDPALLVAHDVG